MLYLSIILFLVGAVFLCVELHFPGFGFFGVSGIALILASVVLLLFAVPFFGAYIVLGEVFGLAAGGYFAWQYMKKHQIHNKLILNETLYEDKADLGGLDILMGKNGIAKTSLRPFGVAVFSGNDVEVYSDGDYIAEQTPVKVVRVSEAERKVFVQKSDARAN